MLDLNDLLRHMVEQRGSDLHVKVGSVPYVRIDGRLTVTPFDKAAPADTEAILEAIIPSLRHDELEQRSETDFAHSVSASGGSGSTSSASVARSAWCSGGCCRGRRRSRIWACRPSSVGWPRSSAASCS